MKRVKLISRFIIILLFAGLLFIVDARNIEAACPEIKDLASEYSSLHAQEIKKQCVTNGVVNSSDCIELAEKAWQNFEKCFADCGGNNPDLADERCGTPYSSSGCDRYNCVMKLDNDCALKCKDYYMFNYNSSDKNSKSSDANNNQNNSGNVDNLNSNLVGLSFSSSYGVSPCIGSTPKNSELCPGDDQNVTVYTEKQLVDACSIPEGSEPKCEYFCKTEHLDDGTCKEYGIFRKFLGYLYNLFWVSWR
jgi:hypothetical protein